MNPFTTLPIYNSDGLTDYVTGVIPEKEVMEPKEEKIDNDFMHELRSFMHEFEATDLNIDSIEEPASMTMQQANFYLKMYNESLLEEQNINELCDSEIERVTRGVNAFRESRLKEVNRKKNYFNSILEQFALSELQGKKAKSLKLPYGVLSFRKQSPKYKYESEKEILETLKEHNPDMININTTESINKVLLKKEGTIFNGKLYLGNVLVPGISIEEQENKFEIK